jgi:hypothetical protein
MRPLFVDLMLHVRLEVVCCLFGQHGVTQVGRKLQNTRIHGVTVGNSDPHFSVALPAYIVRFCSPWRHLFKSAGATDRETGHTNRKQLSEIQGQAEAECFASLVERTIPSALEHNLLTV